MRWLVILVALIAAQPLMADSNLPPAYWANRQLPDPKQEAKAKALTDEPRGLSIADADAELAVGMRGLVQWRIAAGEKPSDVPAWLAQRGGAWISYEPTLEPAPWPLWLASIKLLLIGDFLTRHRIRMKSSG